MGEGCIGLVWLKVPRVLKRWIRYTGGLVEMAKKHSERPFMRIIVEWLKDHEGICTPMWCATSPFRETKSISMALGGCLQHSGSGCRSSE